MLHGFILISYSAVKQKILSKRFRLEPT